MAEKLFSKISTYGELPDGRMIQSHRSYPLGAPRAVYDRLDAGVVLAFGTHNSRTVGEFLKE